MELKWQDDSIALHSSVYMSHGDIMDVGIGNYDGINDLHVG